MEKLLPAASHQHPQDQRKKRQVSISFLPFPGPSQSPRITSGWVSLPSRTGWLRTGDVTLHLNLNRVPTLELVQPHTSYLERVWRKGVSVTKMWGADARVPQINVHHAFCRELIQGNTKCVELALEYLYSPTPSLAVGVHMS